MAAADDADEYVTPRLPTAGRRWRRAMVAGVAALAATVAGLPGTASAANVDRLIGLDRIDVTAAPGEVNEIRVSDDGTGFVRIRDAVTLTETTSPCVSLSAVEVRCSVGPSTPILVRPGDRDNRIEVATTRRFGIDGGPGKDTYVGGLASTTNVLFLGGGGVDTASYADAPSGVVVGVGDGPRDGRAGVDSDDIVDAENLVGSRFGDRLTSTISGVVAARLEGGAGDDTLTSGFGIDTLVGGAGLDTLSSGSNVDRIVANDTERDTIDCGEGSQDEVVASSIGERSIIRCEKLFTASPPPPGGGLIGTARLTPTALRVPAGEIAQLRLAWRHPRTWRRLRRITLRLYSRRAADAAIDIRPRAERIAARGAVELVRKSTRIRRKGKSVTARLALRLDHSLAGRRLRIEVEAIDTRGARQLERDAGSIRIAGQE